MNEKGATAGGRSGVEWERVGAHSAAAEACSAERLAAAVASPAARAMNHSVRSLAVRARTTQVAQPLGRAAVRAAALEAAGGARPDLRGGGRAVGSPEACAVRLLAAAVARPAVTADTALTGAVADLTAQQASAAALAAAAMRSHIGPALQQRTRPHRAGARTGR